MAEESPFEVVTVAELPDAPNPTRHKKEIDEAVGATAFGFNVYVAEPGEQLPWGTHVHPDHEELLYVLAGQLRIHGDEETITVGRGEVVFVPPGTVQRAVATGTTPAKVIAAGAPKDSDGAELREYCPVCGEATDRTYEAEDGGETYVLSCAACGTETARFGAGPREE